MKISNGSGSKLLTKDADGNWQTLGMVEQLTLVSNVGVKTFAPTSGGSLPGMSQWNPQGSGCVQGTLSFDPLTEDEIHKFFGRLKWNPEATLEQLDRILEATRE